MVLYFNRVRENGWNTTYPYRMEIASQDDLKKVVCYDHVCAEYAEFYRKNDNFISADCSMFDVDNMGSDEPGKWATPQTVRNMFPDVPFYISYSRNHMKEKDGKAPRPKFHVYFPDVLYTDKGEYRQLKETVCRYFTAFDPNAKDAARFFYGVKNPQIEFFDGGLLLSDFMKAVHNDEETTSTKTSKKQESGIIPEGSRHCTLISYAARVLKRWGDTQKANYLFQQESKKCVPPLEENELTSIWRDARNFFHDKVECSSDYLPAEIYELLSTGRTLKPEDFSDLGQASVFVRESHNLIKFCASIGYLRYNGMVWCKDELGVQGELQQLTKYQLKEVSFLKQQLQKEKKAAIMDEDTPNQASIERRLRDADAYNKFVIKNRNSPRISAVLDQAKPMVQIDISKFDKDEFLLNTPAGTVDLRKQEVRPHNPEDFCMKITAVGPDTQGKDIFQSFLETITCNDKELEYFLQLIAGMCLVGAVYNEAFVIAYGGGKNGKSTFFNLLSKVMGAYSGTISTEVLLKNSRTNKKNEFAELRGKRIVLASELEDGSRLDSAVMKKLSSVDDIHAEKKYFDPFGFEPTHTTILCTNHLPRVDAMDNGTWRRFVTVPFNAVIQDNCEVKNYAKYLFQNCGGAVLSWMIEGARKFIDAGCKLKEPEIVKLSNSNYMKENNWIKNYLLECCEVDRVYKERAGQLYNNFRDYCLNVGEPIKDKATFKRAMIEAGFGHHSDSQGAYYSGVRIKMLTIPYVTPPMVKDDDEIENFFENNLEF